MLKVSRKTATLRDVAALAGMDKATASRALNGKGYISSETRDAAFKAAQELGYQPDLYAQRLKGGPSHNTIALLAESDLGVLTQQTSFINHRLDEMGSEVQVHNVPHYVSHLEEKQVALVNRVRRQRPGAIICAASLVPAAFHELKLFMEEGGVVVGCGEKIDMECDQVIFDTQRRAYLAAQHLLELGHREIGFCVHNEFHQDAIDLSGFSHAMEEYGAPIQKDWIFGGGNYEEGGGRLAEAYFDWPKKPTGLCIVNDVSASAFVTVMCRNGVNVPGDVSVVGFDDALAARYAFVPLTSANYPLEAIGQNVAEFAQSRLEGYSGPPRTVVVQSEIITRSSTAPYGPKGGLRTRMPSTLLSNRVLTTAR
jgi:DNA-binding LacI/PurR family transcriptional regulator